MLFVLALQYLMEGVKKVLVLTPSKSDYKAIAKIKDSMKGYEFHCFEPPQQWKLFHYLPSDEETLHHKDFLGCLESAIEYVHQHNIDAVIFSSDYSSLIAAALCQETGLIGSSFESKFICMHKYYSRKAEPSKLWYRCVSVDSNDIEDIDSWAKYPCYVKPTSLTGGLIQFKVYNKSQLQEALATHRRCLGPQFDSLAPLLKPYLDEHKYPFATSKVSVVEELVEGASQHFLDGWVDDGGSYHMWASFDLIFYSPPAVFGYVTPSQESANVVCAMKEVAARVVKNFKLKNTFIHTELWKRGSRIDLVEVNGRFSGGTFAVYNRLYNASLYKAATYLACGEPDKCWEESPENKPPPNGVSMSFNVTTFGEGMASDLLNYPLAHTLGEREGVYNSYDEPGVRFFVQEDTWISPTQANGVLLAGFNLFGSSFQDVYQRGKDIMSRLLLQPQYTPGFSDL